MALPTHQQNPAFSHAKNGMENPMGETPDPPENPPVEFDPERMKPWFLRTDEE